MGLFSPVKKHPNRFNYVPRYYDPAKEAREQRRRELRGERGGDIDDAVADGTYKPGDYLRRRKAMRIERNGTDDAERKSSQKSSLTFVLVAAFILLAAYLLVPRIVEVFDRMQNPHAAVGPDNGGKDASSATEEAEFDPYAPIVIVPNDYQE